jgi:hypothetical protein
MMNKALTALYNIQKKLYADGSFFTKQGKNKHFNSKYLQLPDLLAKVVPLLHDEGCMLLQGSRHSDNPDVAIITTRIIHVESGDELLNETDLPVAKLTPQNMGMAVTYGRRYGLEPVFGIPTKDDDGEGAMNREEPKKEEPPASLFDPYVKGTGWDKKKVQAVLKQIEVNGEKINSTDKLKAAKEAIGEEGIILALKAHDKLGGKNE